jgi:hypothetical protein
MGCTPQMAIYIRTTFSLCNAAISSFISKLRSDKTWWSLDRGCAILASDAVIDVTISVLVQTAAAGSLLTVSPCLGALVLSRRSAGSGCKPQGN